MKAARHLRVADADLESDDFVVVGVEPQPLIKPGVYDAVGVDYRRSRVHDQHKIIVVFEVIVPAPDTEYGLRRVRLARYYNVDDIGGGRLRAPRNGYYAREWTLVTDRRITRHDRPTPKAFIGVMVSVEVVTVTKDGSKKKPRPIPLHAQYSKIDRIIERKAGGACL